MDSGKHYAAAISAFVIWGFFAIPLRAISDHPAGQILYFRILFSVFVLAAILVFKRQDIVSDLRRFRSQSPGERRTTMFLVFSGAALLTLNWLTFIYIVNHINIKTASFSYLVCPVITAVFGYLLLKERLSRTQWIAVALCSLSCVLMGLSSRMELAYSILTAVTYALYLVSQRRNQGFDRIIVLAVQISLALLILTLASPLLLDEVPSGWRFYAVILAIAVCFTVLPLFLNLFALNRINSATIGILMYLNPLINFTVALVVFGEHITTLQLSGYLIIIVALVMFNFQNFRKLHAAVVAPRS